MRLVKKYLALITLMSMFPICWIIGKNFVTEAKTDIYGYIPQESDIVIEINSRNFISEIIYQRIYNEEYVLNKVEVQESDVEETGIDYFSKVVLFREKWAEDNVWIAVVGVKNKKAFKKYAQNKVGDLKIEFGKSHAIIQLTASKNQEKIDEHLKNIASQNIKPFTARVDLKKYFKKDKEINCYMIPQSSDASHQLIDGYINMDFHQDHIDIGGEFNTVSTFKQTPSIAYAMNEDVGFSLRSSLNVFNSLWWFSEEEIEDVPDYKQMAVDYDGVKMFMVDLNWGYQFPFKTFPEMQMRVDAVNGAHWKKFFEEIQAEGKVKADTLTKSLITEQGAFFQYNLTDESFELSRSGVNFEPASETDVCFDFQMKIESLLNNTKFAVDEDNPPSEFEQMVGMSVANEMVSEMHVFDDIEEIRFQMKKSGDAKIAANGKVQMKNREGQSIVECMFFMTEALLFVKGF